MSAASLIKDHLTAGSQVLTTPDSQQLVHLAGLSRHQFVYQEKKNITEGFESRFEAGARPPTYPPPCGAKVSDHFQLQTQERRRG